jgi:hypothetical protein
MEGRANWDLQTQYDSKLSLCIPRGETYISHKEQRRGENTTSDSMGTGTGVGVDDSSTNRLGSAVVSTPFMR